MEFNCYTFIAIIFKIMLLNYCVVIRNNSWCNVVEYLFVTFHAFERMLHIRNIKILHIVLNDVTL